MNTPSINRYKNHRFPGEIISHAVWLYFRFCLSYCDVEELLFARGVTVTYEAIRKWCRKFGASYAKQLRRRQPRPGDKWHLELFFRVLKQGCQIEQLRLQTDQRLLNAIALYLIVAWRIHNITMAGRTYPEAPCDVVFEPREWHTIYTMQHHRPPPRDPPSFARWCGAWPSSGAS
jgi:hypothetical protein